MKNIIQSTILGVMLVGASSVATADVLGFGVAAKAYQLELKDNDSNSNTDAETNIEYSAYLEHPVPLLPNVRLAFADFSFDESDELPEIDSRFTDATLYYEILDNIVELDLGLTVRVFDVAVDAVEDLENDDVSALLYAKAQGNLPFVGLSAGAIAQLGGNGDDAVTDAEVFIKYDFLLGVGVAAGYRLIEQKLEVDKNTDLDAELTGAYLSATFSF